MMEFDFKPAADDQMVPSKQAKITVQLSDSTLRISAKFAAMKKVLSEVGGRLISTDGDIGKVYSRITFVRGKIMDTAVMNTGIEGPRFGNKGEKLDESPRSAIYGWEVNGDMQFMFYEDDLKLVEEMDDIVHRWNSNKTDTL